MERCVLFESTGEPWNIRNVSDVINRNVLGNCILFQKTKTKTFFELLKYIKENWAYYRWIYRKLHLNFRNDFAFSIAIPHANGFEENTNRSAKLPAHCIIHMTEIWLKTLLITDLLFCVPIQTKKDRIP